MQDARTTIVAINADGEAFPLTAPLSLGKIQLSADGSALAYEAIQDPNPANNLVEIRALTSRRTWRVAAGDGCAIFGFGLDASGQRLAYLEVAMRGQLKSALWQITITAMQAPEAPRPRRLHGESTTVLVPLAWSAATDAIVFHAVVPFQAAGQHGIWQAQPDGSNLRLLLHESDFVGEPALSPDGHWLAYLASDADRLPRAYIASTGEPPANRIAAVNLVTGETRTLAETAQSFGGLAWSKARVFFTEGVWADNQFRYDKIRSVQADASMSQILVTVGSSESIGSMQECTEDSLVYSVRRANGDALRRWQDGSVKALAPAPNVEYRVLGCVK